MLEPTGIHLSGYSKELQILTYATSKRDCSNAFIFRNVTFFDFFKISQRTYLQRNSKSLKLPTRRYNLIVSVHHTPASQILPLNMNAQIFLVSEMRRFFHFFWETYVKKFTKI